MQWQTQCRVRPRASPLPQKGQCAMGIIAGICPFGQSGWHGACPYTSEARWVRVAEGCTFSSFTPARHVGVSNRPYPRARYNVGAGPVPARCPGRGSVRWASSREFALTGNQAGTGPAPTPGNRTGRIFLRFGRNSVTLQAEVVHKNVRI